MRNNILHLSLMFPLIRLFFAPYPFLPIFLSTYIAFLFISCLPSFPFSLLLSLLYIPPFLHSFLPLYLFLYSLFPSFFLLFHHSFEQWTNMRKRGESREIFRLLSCSSRHSPPAIPSPSPSRQHPRLCLFPHQLLLPCSDVRPPRFETPESPVPSFHASHA